MATTAIDLEAYLARIGYEGRRDPTLDRLASLQSLHTRAIAFENLDPLLGRPVALDLPALEAKLVQSGRSGYCFEQNLLFGAALRALGFDVTGLAGRVLLDQPPGAEQPRTHMLLLVEIGAERYLADVGFGGLTPTGPLLLEADRIQETPHESFRLVTRPADAFDIEARVGNTWKLLYRFDLTPQLLVDYEVANHYVATYPTSFFRYTIVAARDGRYTLLNDRVTFHHPDGRRETRTIKDAGALIETLADVFGLVVPNPAGLAAAFDRNRAAPRSRVE